MKQLLALAIIVIFSACTPDNREPNNSSPNPNPGDTGGGDTGGGDTGGGDTGGGDTGGGDTGGGDTGGGDTGGGDTGGGDTGGTDPVLPKISIAPAQATEGSGTHDARNIEFVISLDNAADETVTVDWAAVDDSAKQTDDYTANSGQVSFAAGETSKTISVELAAECAVEPDEQFSIQLSNPSNAELATTETTGTILNDDFAGALPSGTGGKLFAGVAEDTLRIPIGVPLGGYLRPPVGGDFFPAGEGFADGDAGPFFEELADRFPNGADHNGLPLVGTPPEATAAHSPYATYSPPSRGYYDSLITKAVALDNGEKTIVIVKTDLIGMIDEIAIEIGNRVKAQTGVDLDDGLLMTATHTHDGPGALANNSIRYFWLAMDNYQPAVYELLVSEITRVVVASLQNMVPARFGYATGQESRERSLNSFRRTRSPWSAERVAEQTEFRKRIAIMRVDEIDDTGAPVRPLAAILNYSAHGIAFSVENFLFSGDVLGAAEREFEETFTEPVVAMFIQSAGGDVNPRADGGNTLRRMERFGLFFAPQARDIYDSISNYDTKPAMRTVTQRILLNREKLAYEGSEYPYEWGAAQCNNNGSEDCIPAPTPDADDLADNNVGENAAFLPQDTRIAVARIGSAVLQLQPGEPVNEYGLRLMEDSPYGFDDTFIFSLAQDHIGYILPDSKDDWLLGGTEGTTTFWGWKQGGRLRAATNELMAALTCGEEPADEYENSYRTDIITDYAPTVSPLLKNIVTQTTDIKRFETTRFGWEGGDPIIDLPVVTLEIQQDDGSWQPAKRVNGKVINTFFEMHLAYELNLSRHLFEVEFEAPLDWPLGTYRFAIVGRALTGIEPEEYTLESAPFSVSAADNLVVSAITSNGNEHSVTASYPVLPDNYRIIDPEVHPDNSAPVRVGQVSFAIGAGTAVDSEADISGETATYSVTSGVAPTTAAVMDQYGNTGSSP